MKISGGCHCGQIRFEAEIDPDKVGACHCADCQALSGAPFRVSVPVKPEHFHMQGTPRHYVKMAESGNRRAQAFCPNCGSSLYSTQAENPVAYNLRLGGVKERALLPPKRQIWCDSAMPWLDELDTVPGVPGQS